MMNDGDRTFAEWAKIIYREKRMNMEYRKALVKRRLAVVRSIRACATAKAAVLVVALVAFAFGVLFGLDAAGSWLSK